jgi:dipeptidyl aminopeptidase/acylaminoacyl peptidase
MLMAQGERSVTTALQFKAADLLKQVMIQDLAVAPDGGLVVFSQRTIVSNRYTSALWSVPYDGGDCLQLTGDGFNDRHPRFAPDGNALLFLSDRSGTPQLWLYDLATGTQRRLAEHDGEIGSAEWSPDGREIAFTAPSDVDRYIIGDREDPIARRITNLTWRLDGRGIRDTHASIFVLDVASGVARRVTAPDYEATRPVWSPDGARIGFIADPREEAALGEAPQFWSIDRGGLDSPVQHTNFGGFAVTGAWSDEGKLAVVGMNETPGAEWANLNLYLIDGDELQHLGTELDRPIGNWSFGDLVDPDAATTLHWQNESHVSALVADRGTTLPHRFDALRRSEAERLVDGEIICSSIAAASGRIAVVATERGRPGEIYAVEHGTLRGLTALGGEWLEARADPERFEIAHADGTTFDGWLVRARDIDGPAPTVIQVHGGPHLAHGPTPWLEMLALADAGINVLYANPRGSMGYGEAFSRPVHAAYGDADGIDLLRLVDWAVEEKIAEPGRIGLFGLSYGGFMTLWMMGHYPGVFAAGISENPLANAIGAYGANDITAWAWEQFGHLPENVDEFLKRSPFMSIHRNTAPLLLLQSDDDLRCPPLNTEIVFAILRIRGVITEMIRYPDEPHYLAGTGRPDRRIDRIERIVAWFERYL